MDTADIRALFPDLEGVAYLNTASMAVGCAPAKQAYERALEQWSAGRFDFTNAERAGEAARSLFAHIVGADADEIAIVPSVSTGAGIVAANLPPAKPGENVVVAGCEFSSNYFPWLLLRERGYDVRVIPAANDAPAADSYAELADAGTRLVAASAVQSATGYRTDLGALSQLAARSGAWLFVDACQAAGALAIDVHRDKIDFLAAASHKFLIGSRGMGYLFVRRERLANMRPIVPGWKAAREPFESFYGPSMDLSPTASKLDASLVWFAALADAAALAIFQRFGLTTILERNAELSQRLHAALADRMPDFRPYPVANRSTIVSIPVDDAEATNARLRDANVVASVRAGRVRLSVHFYNREEDIDRAAAVMAGG